MSKLDWRNNRIGILTGDKNDKDIIPTYAQYLTWASNAERSITAVGADYMNHMITKLEEIWDGDELPVLGPDKAVPDITTSIPFRTLLVSLAHDCGKSFIGDVNPIINENLVKANYQIVFLEITSLGQQVSTAAQEHFPELFNDVEIKGHPLRALMEWIMLKRSFNPLRGSKSDPGPYWDKLNAAVDVKLQLTQLSVRTWIKNITTARNNLIQLVLADAVDSVIKGKMINVLKKAKHSDSSVSLNWMIMANTWSNQYEQNPASITWKFLKSQVLKEIAKHPDSTGAPATSEGAPRPRLNPAIPTNIALHADAHEHENAEHNPITYHIHAAMAAINAAGATPSDPHAHKICDNCGGKGHGSVVCPSRPVVAGAGAMRQRQRQWQGGGGRGSPYARGGGPGTQGSPRGGAGRGSEALRRSSGSQRGGGSGQGPARYGGGRGLRGGAPPQQSEALLDIVGAAQDIDAQAMVSIGAYADDGFDEEPYEAEEHSRAAELGQHFRDEAFVIGEGFGGKDTEHLVPKLADPAAAHLDRAPTIPNPKTRNSGLKTIGKTMISSLPSLPFLPAATTALKCIRACIPNHPPRTPTVLLSVMLSITIFLILCPRTNWADETAHHSAFVTTNMSGSAAINYLIDCACTISIISDSRFIKNKRPAPPNFVRGFQGGKSMTWQADLHLPVIAKDNATHTLILKDVFYDP